jgi:predicted transcriptional regulator of viral defense system
MKKTLPTKRELLALLLSKTNGIIKITDAQTTLSVSREKARLVLRALCKSGWLKRIKSGFYIPIPLEAKDASLAIEDPIITASTLYAPCYMGGWTAVSLWNLTDQLFLKTWVMTTNPVHHKIAKVQDTSFILKQVSPNYMFGLKPHWVNNNKVLYSDPHKTVIDFANFINDYGKTAFMDVFRAYLESEYKDLDMILQYSKQADNRVIFKRLGFALELIDRTQEKYLKQFQLNISKGYSKLDNSGLCDRIVRKWNLIVPKDMVHD